MQLVVVAPGTVTELITPKERCIVDVVFFEAVESKMFLFWKIFGRSLEDARRLSILQTKFLYEICDDKIDKGCSYNGEKLRKDRSKFEEISQGHN